MNVDTSPLILLGLSIDDEREMYSAALTSEGFRVHVALNGNDAINSAIAEQPQAIVIGQVLPPGGAHVCAVLKDNAATSRIPLVFIYSFDAPCRADVTMQRPTRPDVLIAAIQQLMKS